MVKINGMLVPDNFDYVREQTPLYLGDSGNSHLGHFHQYPMYEYQTYATTGTVYGLDNYFRYSIVRCQYCGRKNSDANPCCDGCGAIL